MTTREKKMICADCGVEMNHHADKVDYYEALEDGEEVDAAFGGVVEEAHTCPACGKTKMRRAQGH